IKCTEKGIDVLTSHLGKTHKDTVERCAHLAGLLMRYGTDQSLEEHYREAEQAFKKAINIAESLPTSHRLIISQALDLLATSYVREKRYKEAESATRRSYEIRLEALGQENDLTKESARHWSAALRFVAHVERTSGNDRESEVLLEKAASLLDKT